MERSVGVHRRRLFPHRFRFTPYHIRTHCWDVAVEGTASPKRTSLALERKDWEDAVCSVCMEFPHNAVLLLCSSHDKGCRPYMCGTSHRHSNCLDQFKKAYTKVDESVPVIGETPSSFGSLAGGTGSVSSGWNLISGEKSDVTELATCPLCRGQVKGWTVVEPARQYLNNKKRSCMQDDCSYVGTYRELRKHVRSQHPCLKPREVDPLVQQKWRSLEHERERQDVISTIRSSMPRSVVLGDYVIEMTNSDADDTDGDGGAEEFGAGSRGISRSILYFFLREGARIMRLQRDHNGATSTATNEQNDNGSSGYDILPPMAAAADAFISDADDVAYFSGEDGDYVATPVISQARDVDTLGADRRRRRRRRSRGRSVVGLS